MITILLTDDDQDDHELFNEALASVADVYNVVHVYNGAEAMDYLCRRKAYKTSLMPLPDLIVLDINMPLKNGFETLQEIKAIKQFTHIPAYILTTSWENVHLAKCRELGCAGYFVKSNL